MIWWRLDEFDGCGRRRTAHCGLLREARPTVDVFVDDCICTAITYCGRAYRQIYTSKIFPPQGMGSRPPLSHQSSDEPGQAGRQEFSLAEEQIHSTVLWGWMLLWAASQRRYSGKLQACEISFLLWNLIMFNTVVFVWYFYWQYLAVRASLRVLFSVKPNLTEKQILK